MSKVAAPAKPSSIRIGFVPLVDAAPLIVASGLGYFASEGLNVTLHREIGWGNVRDKLVYGALHLSHALVGMAPLSQIDEAQYPERLTSIMSLGAGGNAITFGRAMVLAGVTSAQALSRQKSSQPPLLAHVFGCSFHHYLLRDWLSAAGVDPDRDVRLCVLPPPQMTRQLTLHYLDGFCAGEPWNTVAERESVGSIVAWTQQWMPMHPEKVLATTDRWLKNNASAAEAIVRAVLRGCAFCEQPSNLPQLASMLSAARHLDTPAADLTRSLSAKTETGSAVRSWANNTTFPSATAIVWLLEQMRRWNHLTPGINVVGVAAQAVNSSAYRIAAAALGIDCPKDDFPPLQTRTGWFETKLKKTGPHQTGIMPTADRLRAASAGRAG